MKEAKCEVDKLHAQMRNKDKVRINVGGQLFLTKQETLRSLPGTMLYYLDETDESYDPHTDEYYFDRNPTIFSAILDYYRTGELHLPNQLCGPFVKKELSYWGIDENLTQPCCWAKYKEFEESEVILKQVDRAFQKPHMQWCTATFSTSNAFQDIAESAAGGCNQNRCTCNPNNARRKLWIFLEDPGSSTLARIWALIDLLLIAISIFITTAESVESFRVKTEYNFSESIVNYSTTNRKEHLYLETDLHPVMLVMEWASNGIFTLELLLRMYACPSRWRFFSSLLNWVDIVCVSSVWVVLVLHFFPPGPTFKMMTVYRMFLGLRSLRVIRLFRVARHYRGWRILVLALKASRWEIFVLCVFIFTGMLVFSTLIFYVEFWHPDQFHNIPVGFWWSIVTMTTVGYGDIYPVTGLGYVVGSFCALCGMLATGLPIPIIANNFNIFYSYSRVREKLQKRLVRARRSIVMRTSSLNLSKSKTDETELTIGQQSPAASRTSTSTLILTTCATSSSDDQIVNKDEPTLNTSKQTDDESMDKLEKSTDDIKLAVKPEIRELTASDIKILYDSTPRPLNGILKRQSSFSGNNLVANCIHDDNNSTHPKPNPSIKKHRRLQSSHSMPLFSLSHEHELVKKTSSVSFKIERNITK